MVYSADPYQFASDLDLHCLQRQGISRFSRTRVKCNGYNFIVGSSVKKVFVSLLKKGSALKGKHLLPLGANAFLLE